MWRLNVRVEKYGKFINYKCNSIIEQYKNVQF